MTLVLSCATKTQRVKSYESLGQTLTSAYLQLKPACDTGAIPADKCIDIRYSYNNARILYIQAGETLKQDVMSADDSQRYEMMIANVMEAVQYLTTLAIQYGR